MSAPGSASRNTVSVMVDVGSATVSYTASGRITDAPMARESMTAPIVTSTVPTDPATVSVSPTSQPFGSAASSWTCLLYTSDAADDLLCVDLGGRRIIK